MTRAVWLGLRFGPASVLLASLLPGCGSGSNRACIPGQSVACACRNGRIGAQSCNASGSGYGVCECSGGGTGGAAGSVGAGGLTGGGGAAGSSGIAGAAGNSAGGHSGAGGGQAGAAGRGGGAGGSAGNGGGGGAAGSSSIGTGGNGAAGSAASGAAGSGGGSSGTAGACGGVGASGLGGRTGAGGAIDDPCLQTGQPWLHGDFDGDGVQDCAILPAGSVQLYPGLGSGKFQGTPVTSTVTCVGQRQNVAGDFDGDGRDDILVRDTQFSPDSMDLLVEHADGTFACPPFGQNMAFMPQGYGVALAATGDFTGDGRVDVFVVGVEGLDWTPPGPHAVEWIVFSAQPAACEVVQFQTKTTDAGFTLGSHGTAYGITVSDLDADGRLDVTVQVSQAMLTGPVADSSVHVYGNGDGTFHCGVGETMACTNGCVVGQTVCQSNGMWGACQCITPTCTCPL